MDRKEIEKISKKLVPSGKREMIDVKVESVDENTKNFDLKADVVFGGDMDVSVGWHNSNDYEVKVSKKTEVSKGGKAKLKKLKITSPEGVILLLKCHIL